MIIVDTNVISETQKKRPDPRVIAWLNAQDQNNLYITAVTAAELLFGAHAVKDRDRMRVLSDAIAHIIEEQFYTRVLPFDATAAYFYGMRVGELRKKGVTIGLADGQIGSIAIANNYASVATRDHTPFAAMKLDVINPWIFQQAAVE